MKLASVQPIPFGYRASEDHPSRFLRRQLVTCLFVRVEAEDGTRGYGEVCDSFCCNYAAPAAAVISEALAPLLMGEHTSAIETLAQKMRRSTRRRLGDGGIVAQAISGVEIALWDLCGKLEGKPVHELLGATRREIPVYASGSFLVEGPAEWHMRFFEPSLERGINAVKVRIGLDYEAELATAARLRQCLGEKVQLMVDGGECFTLPTALEVARALADLPAAFFEEPIPQYQTEAIARLVEKSPLPIAYGEHLYGLHDIRAALFQHTLHVVQPDAAICGGISEGVKIADVAKNAGIPIIPHSCAGPIALAANLQMCAANDAISMLEYAFPLEPLWDAVGGSQFSVASVRDGKLQVPGGRGLGVDLNEEVFDRHTYVGPSDLRTVRTTGD